MESRRDLAHDLDQTLVRQAMRRAIDLSRTVLGTTSPNPPVGAVLLDESGQVVGEGATQPPGGAHAEVVALTCARGRGRTVVVTLEPCHHTGRTGPCTKALVAGGVTHVVVACPEPTSEAGGGVLALRAAGLTVTEHVLEEEVAGGPLQAWLHLQRTGRPFVTWKYAATMDGRSAAADGTSRWITGAEARADVHRLRAECDAVVVGSGTVLADNPLLTTRPDPGHQPLRVVLDRRGRTPLDAKIRDDSAPTLIVSEPDLSAVLENLAGRGVVSVLLEGGPSLAGAFLQAGFVDRVVAYLAPALLGAGLPVLQDSGIMTIDDALRLEITDVTRLGADVRLSMRRT